VSDDELERRLADLGPRIDWPATPDLAAAVAARLAAAGPDAEPADPVDLAGRVRARIEAGRPGRRPWLAQGSRRLVALAAAAVLLAAAVVVALPGPRAAVADLLGIGGVRITQGGGTATVPPTSVPVPPGLGEQLNLGRRTSLAEAAGLAGRPVALPARLGRPDAVWIDDRYTGPAVSLVYRPRPGLPASGATGVGLLLTEFRADLPNGELLKKLVLTGGRVREVKVGQARGLWIEGPPHEVYLVAPDGSPLEASGRLAGDTLLWQRGKVTMRLEAQVDQATAVAIATTVR
jgi:hypothetical protein